MKWKRKQTGQLSVFVDVWCFMCKSIRAVTETVWRMTRWHLSISVILQTAWQHLSGPWREFVPILLSLLNLLCCCLSENSVKSVYVKLIYNSHSQHWCVCREEEVIKGRLTVCVFVCVKVMITDCPRRRSIAQGQTAESLSVSRSSSILSCSLNMSIFITFASAFCPSGDGCVICCEAGGLFCHLRKIIKNNMVIISLCLPVHPGLCGLVDCCGQKIAFSLLFICIYVSHEKIQLSCISKHNMLLGDSTDVCWW